MIWTLNNQKEKDYEKKTCNCKIINKMNESSRGKLYKEG